MLQKISLLTGFVFLTSGMYAYNLRQISNNEGLSNSAILSICQDNERFVWFGSCDGLNMYDGLRVQVYKPTPDNPNSLSGNLIEGIMEAENDILWIATNHGFCRLEKKRRIIEYHNEFQGKYHWAKTPSNEVFAIHEDHFIDYYDKDRKTFLQIPFDGIANDRIRTFFIDADNRLWILTDDGTIIQASISLAEPLPRLTKSEAFEHTAGVLYLFKEKDRIYFIDQAGFLFEYDVLSGEKNLIMNLSREMSENGVVSDIIRDNDDYLIAFKSNGLIRLKNIPDKENKYQPERIKIYCGVLSLCKDDLQDIIWIGTDGQGVYMYSRDSFSFETTTFNELPFRIQKPVRALLLDSLNTLWIGTKGDGILMIHDFHVNDDTGSKHTGHQTTRNSELASNAVYAFAKSHRNLIWIGSDGPGLNYYSYREKRIRQLPSKSSESIVYVHSICEVSDSVLWLATVGSGILKVVITGTADEPVIESVERTMFTRDEVSYNYFFSACRENDSVLWFGNRGYGMQRLSLQTESFRQVVFRNRDIKTINDILSLHRDKKGDMWLGSSFGITKLLQYDNDSVVYENYNEIEGLPNNTIHGILEDDLGHLWLSTNNGIVQFDPETKDFRIYNHRNGLDVIEFSDGAYFKCEETGILFFGGTNGFLTVAQDVFTEKKLAPPIRFTGLRIYENEYNLADFMRKKNNKEYLELKYAQNFFSVSFSALDYINGQNSRYSYILENFNNQWIEKRIFNVVTFTKVPPGEYTLRVKYDNGSSGGQNNDIYSLRIVILPPWYLSVWACLLYLAGVVSVVFFCYFWFRKYYRNKREIMIEKLNRQQKEAIYESKLRFFTNLTHELSTPLTLIYGPCSRIVSHPGTDAYVKKYATLILKNAERLNALIQELIEFRRIETGHKSCSIERLSISETAGNIADSFTDLAETRNIDYQINIKNGLYWNTDKGCFSKILTNLLSNAFKYTPDNGKIEVNIHLMDDALQALVSNTGKGFDEKDIPFIFDRYTVLANFENQKGMSSRNGLGLAICHNLAKLLHGEIHVRSIPGVLTEFRVTLPHQDVNVSEKREIREAENVLYHQFDSEKPVVETGDYQYIKSRATILVIDDDPEMLWFIAEIFKEHYNVIPLDNPSRVDEALLQTPPNLIISDIMMPQIDGITLLKQTKSDKRTHHIPFILLSAKNTPEEQVEGIEAGADIYLTKPFNVDYLRSVVDHLLQRQDDLKDYYHSAISSFEFMDGKYIHKEDKIFMENAIRIIDKNIQDPAFSPQQLATQMGMSIRHLYRKLKTTTDYTPADLIREYKLAIAEGLLVTSQLSIDEIMYKAGFSNRGSFYKAFLQKFGLTPKNYRIQKKEAT